MFIETMKRLCSDLIKPAEQHEKKEAVNNTAELKLTDKIKFRSDIETLQERYGELVPGKRIVLSLQDALLFLPRDRKRVDAYRSLQKYLSEREVYLTIYSNKTKKNGQE